MDTTAARRVLASVSAVTTRDDTRPFWIGYLLLATSLWGVGFGILPRPPAFVAYVGVLGVYLLPCALVLRRRVPRWQRAALVVFAPFVVMLLVVDPFEVGLYGRDAYYTLGVVRAFENGASVGDIFNDFMSWPLHYVWVATIRPVLGIPVEPLAKYLPLFSVAIPLLVYVALGRLLSETSAFVAAMGAASTKTLLLFETRFVDETIGVVLLFALVGVVCCTDASSRGAKTLLAVLLTALALTHPVTLVVATVLFVCYAVATNLHRVGGVPRRFVPRRTVRGRVGVTWAVTAVILVTVLWLFAAEAFFTTILVNVLTGHEISRLPVDRELIVLSTALVDYGFAVVLATSVGLAAFAVLSRYPHTDWELSWIGVSAVSSVYYAGVLFLGRIVGLDQSRALVYLVPFLIPVAVNVLWSQRVPKLTARRRARGAAILLVSLLVASQLFAVPVYVLFTDTRYTYPPGDATPTEYARAGVQWSLEYDSGLFPNGVESPRAFSGRAIPYDDPGCGDGLVFARYDTDRDPARQEALIERHSKVYTSGGVVVAACTDRLPA